MNKKVSVIVPVHNAEEYLERCVGALLRQDYPDTEILLIENGSEDRSAFLCDRYAEENKNIRAFHNGVSGVSAARNRGLEQASGEYVAFADADDWTDPDYVSALVGEMENADMAVSGWHERNRDYTYEKAVLDADRTFEKLFGSTEGHYLSVWGKMFRKDKCPVFDPEISYLEDSVFLCEYLRNASRVSFTDRCTYHYYVNENSLTHDYAPSARRFSAFKARERVIELVKGDAEKTAIAESKYAETVRYLLFSSYLYGHRQEIQKYIPLLERYRDSFRSDPRRRFKTKVLYEGYYRIVKHNLGVSAARFWNSLKKNKT